jgi:hypothetical protein
MRVVYVLAAVALTARAASAQDPLTNAKKAAQKAANAASAHVEAEQRPDGQQPKTAAKTAPKTAAKEPQKPAVKPSVTKPGTQLNVAKADTIPTPTVIFREQFAYTADGRRDPFVSLLTTNELRPTLSDLKLSTIIYDPSSRRSIAILRDQTNNAQYRVTTGSALGRLRVTAIHVLSVVFNIEEFGTSRIDSLVLRDTTNRRGR